MAVSGRFSCEPVGLRKRADLNATRSKRTLKTVKSGIGAKDRAGDAEE